MLRSIAHVLIDPVNLVLLGVAAVYVAQRAGYRRLANYAKALWAGLVFIMMFTPYPVWLTIQQEHQHKPLNLDELPNEPYRVVILGSGYGRDTLLRPTQRLSMHATGRMLEGYRIYRERAVPLVTSGYSRRGIYSQAEVTAEALLDLGVIVSDTLRMDITRNTRDEAKQYVARWGTKYPVILVTDAMHMGRAAGWFRHFGARVIPAPTNFDTQRDHYAPDGDVWDLRFTWDSLKNMERVQRLLHEWAGLAHLKWERRFGVQTVVQPEP